MVADSSQPLIECEHCASIYRRHELEHGETASCTRCGSTLWRYSGLTLSNWLALAITALIIFGIANAYPVASMSVQGMMQQASLLDAVAITWRQGHEIVAVMTGLSGFVLPCCSCPCCCGCWALVARARTARVPSSHAPAGPAAALVHGAGVPAGRAGGGGEAGRHGRRFAWHRPGRLRPPDRPAHHFGPPVAPCDLALRRDGWRGAGACRGPGPTAC